MYNLVWQVNTLSEIIINKFSCASCSVYEHNKIFFISQVFLIQFMTNLNYTYVPGKQINVAAMLFLFNFSTNFVHCVLFPLLSTPSITINAPRLNIIFYGFFAATKLSLLNIKIQTSISRSCHSYLYCT